MNKGAGWWRVSVYVMVALEVCVINCDLFSAVLRWLEWIELGRGKEPFMLAEPQVEGSHGLESLFRREDSSHDNNDTGNED